MKHQLVMQTHKQVKFTGMKSQAGMATAMLVAIIAMVVIFIAAGVMRLKIVKFGSRMASPLQ